MWFGRAGRRRPPPPVPDARSNSRMEGKQAAKRAEEQPRRRGAALFRARSSSPCVAPGAPADHADAAGRSPPATAPPPVGVDARPPRRTPRHRHSAAGPTSTRAPLTTNSLFPSVYDLYGRDMVRSAGGAVASGGLGSELEQGMALRIKPLRRPVRRPERSADRTSPAPPPPCHLAAPAVPDAFHSRVESSMPVTLAQAVAAAVAAIGATATASAPASAPAHHGRRAIHWAVLIAGSDRCEATVRGASAS